MTIKELAAIAGVSYSTISKALNGTGRISPATRARIQALADEYGFQLNANAQSLKSAKSRRVAIIFSRSDFQRTERSWVVSTHLRLVSNCLEDHGYDFIVNTDIDRNGNSNIRYFASRKMADGFILLADTVSRADIEFLAKNKIPFAFLHKRPVDSGQWNYSYFISDNIEDGKLATSYLLEHVGDKILCVTSNHPEYRDYWYRTNGYLAAMEARGASPQVIKCDMSDVDTVFAQISAEELVRYDGIYCQWDGVALSLMSRLAQKHLLVPKAVSIIGHNDIEAIRYFAPGLTSLHDARETFTARCVDYLVGQIEAPDSSVVHYSIVGTVVERESVKRTD